MSTKYIDGVQEVLDNIHYPIKIILIRPMTAMNCRTPRVKGCGKIFLIVPTYIILFFHGVEVLVEATAITNF
ncbi:MAG: hypothetical protein ABSH09_26610, partial [Bryobacteraceae bacterium]